jgi:hypothetical protein
MSGLRIIVAVRYAKVNALFDLVHRLRIVGQCKLKNTVSVRLARESSATHDFDGESSGNFWLNFASRSASLSGFNFSFPGQTKPRRESLWILRRDFAK